EGDGGGEGRERSDRNATRKEARPPMRRRTGMTEFSLRRVWRRPLWQGRG
ncbi:hypothetical protein BHM03_00033675, partial [Ensete ventricosum]